MDPDPYWSPTSNSGSGSGKNEYGSTTLVGECGSMLFAEFRCRLMVLRTKIKLKLEAESNQKSYLINVSKLILRHSRKVARKENPPTE